MREKSAEGDTVKNQDAASGSRPAGVPAESSVPSHVNFPDNEGEFIFPKTRNRNPGKLPLQKDEAPQDSRNRRILPNYIRRIREESVSFYFTNFPAGCDEIEMRKVFVPYDRVRDVFIPKFQTGRRYGFLRFAPLQNPLALERQLDGIWVGTCQLMVNKARYNESDVRARSKLPQQGDSQGTMRRIVDHERSEYEAIKTVQFYNKPEFYGWLTHCLIAVPSRGVELFSISERLIAAGFQGVKVIRLEGGEILLRPTSTSLKEALALDVAIITSLGLDSVRPWTKTNNPDSRVTWLQIRGTPLHCWHTEFFEAVAGIFCSVLSVDAHTVAGDTMNVGRLQIRVENKSFIDEVVQINLEECDNSGENFTIRVAGELGVLRQIRQAWRPVQGVSQLNAIEFPPLLAADFGQKTRPMQQIKLNVRENEKQVLQEEEDITRKTFEEPGKNSLNVSKFLGSLCFC